MVSSRIVNVGQRCAVAIVAGMLLGIFSTHSLAAESVWPQWRGPNRDSQYAGEPWPQSLGEDALTRIWRRELGPSYSGPVVDTKAVFVTETLNETFEIVRALDRDSGEELWQYNWEGAMKVPFFASSNGDWIRSTPALTDEAIYSAGMRDVLVALDKQSGELRWRRDFVSELGTPLPDFGFVSSPLVDGDALYVQAGAAVLKLDRESGRTLWSALRDDGGMYGSAFSSPVIGTLQGKRQLVVQTREILAGVDMENGKVLWSIKIKAFRGMNILTPVIHQDMIFTSTYGGRTISVDIARDGDDYEASQGWTYKSQGYMSTPVVIAGHAYHHLRNERFVCIDLSDGQEKWMSERRFGKYMSLVANQNQILGLDQTGTLHLFRATPERFVQIDSRQVSEDPTWAHLAVVDGRLFIRELNAVSAWQWTESIDQGESL